MGAFVLFGVEIISGRDRFSRKDERSHCAAVPIQQFDLLEILDGGVTPVQKEDVFYFL